MTTTKCMNNKKRTTDNDDKRAGFREQGKRAWSFVTTSIMWYISFLLIILTFIYKWIKCKTTITTISAKHQKLM